MSKKFIIITAAAGLVSFAGAFVFAWLTGPSQVDVPEQSDKAVIAGDKSEEEPEQTRTSTMGTVTTASGPMTKAMTEQQLRNLVLDVRQKMQEYNDRLQALGVRERRLQLTRDTLIKDIENLNTLRIEIASTIANLKTEREKLLKSKLEIDRIEKTNLVSIAAAYDKMDVTGASKIITNMCSKKAKSENKSFEAGNIVSSFDDAVKILYYMSERTKAKLLAELADSQPDLAAALCKRLKQIVEGT
jgi:hypothetical protein